MGLMLALGSFSFWQDQLSQLWGDAELPQLLPRIFTALFPGLCLYSVFYKANKLLLIQSCQNFFFQHGHLGKVISGHKVI